MKIIVDQSIWYKLGRGLMDKMNNQNYSRFNFISTWLNVEEFYYSKSVADSKGKFKSYIYAIKAISTYAKGHIPSNPVEYILKYQDDESQSSSVLYWKLLMNLSNKAEHVKDKLTGNKIILQGLHKLITQKKNDRVGVIVNYLNNALVQDRAKYKDLNPFEKIEYNDYLGEEQDRISKKLVKSICRAHLNEDIVNMHLEKIEWGDLELFIHCFKKSYIIKLESGAIYTVNDVFDIFHFMYVGNADKIWTDERQWRNIILSDSKMHKYLYDS